MKEQWKVIAIIVLLIFVVIFALQNTNVVGIDLFFSKFEVSLVLVVLFSILIGVIIGMIASMAAIQSGRRTNKELEKQLSKEKSTHSTVIIEKDATIAKLRSELEDKERSLRNSTSFSSESAMISGIEDAITEEISTDTEEV